MPAPCPGGRWLKASDTGQRHQTHESSPRNTEICFWRELKGSLDPAWAVCLYRETREDGRMLPEGFTNNASCKVGIKLTAVASSSSGAKRWDSPLLLQSYTRERCSWEPPSRANPLWRCCSSQSSTQYCSHRSRSRGSRALPGLGACRHAEAGENESTEGSALY